MPRRWISRIRRRATDQRGAVLVMVLAFMLVVIAVGLAFMQAGSSEARNAHERWASTNAFWLAEAGYQRYAAEEWTNALWSKSLNFAPGSTSTYTTTDTLGAGGGSYWIAVRDTIISGYPGAVHINTNGTLPVAVGGTDAQRRIDIAAQVLATAFDSFVVFALGDVDIQSNSSFQGVSGKVHADGDITPPSSQTEPPNWSENGQIKPPPFYTEIDSLGGSSIEYYYVMTGRSFINLATPSPDSVYIMDRNQLYLNRRIPPSLVSIVGAPLNPHYQIANLDGIVLDWGNASFFPSPSNKQVIVNFQEMNTTKPVDIIMDSGNGAPSIKTSIIDTRYIGPNTPAGRIDENNWTGGKVQLKAGLTFEPPNGLAIGAYDFEKVSGGGDTNVGTSAWPAMTYVTHDFIQSTGNVNFNGMVLCLGDCHFGGTTNMVFNAGFISELPPSISNVWTPGVTASVEVLSWKEIPRQ